jgi:hypothetical protein
MVLGVPCRLGWRGDVAARLDTRRPASYAHPRCRARATCVPDPGPRERPAGRRGRSSAPDFGPSSRGSGSSRADRRGAGKKRWCRVTTRGRNRWSLNSLRCGLGPLAARALGPGMARFDVGVLTMFRLPPRRLPTVDLSPAFRILAVALVPRPGLILASAPFAQADPRTGSARSGRTVGL